ncbi:unnamed protein product [Pleuronectes platessa]|uniref:Uncharacterized protein n=1 Tax=Pleuronectes platessa TaxID=8262 RepID=A0A9N7Y469_PLEPL|nr:unnamed protein product [Pleuronectes platessa]
MSQRRRQRHRKRRKDLPSSFRKNTSLEARSPPRSPDSVLKLKLCPALPFFPTSSSQSDRSSFDKGSRGEYHDQRKQLLANSSPPPHYTLFESHMGSQAPSPTALESISRGPDGRFIIQPLLEGSSHLNNKNLKKDVLIMNGGASGSGSKRTSLRDSPKSSILSSEKEERKDSPFTVDVQELNRPPSSPGRVRAMARNFSRQGCFYSDDEQGSEALLERASFYSDSSEKKPSDSLRRHHMPGHSEGLRTMLLDRDQDRPHHSGYLPMESQLTDNSTPVSQLDSGLERDNINKCVQLAKEREKMERELESYTADQRSSSRGRDERQTTDRDAEEEPVWKPQDVTIRQKHRPSGQTSRVSDYRRACYFGKSSSPMDRLPTSRIQWDISPVTAVTNLVPAQSPRETTSQHPRTCREISEDSMAVNSSCSPGTQNTSLPMLSPNVASKSSPVLCLETPTRGRSLSPRRELDICRKSTTEQGLQERTQAGGFSTGFRHSYAYAGNQPWDSAARDPIGDGERRKSSASPQYHQPDRTRDYTAKRDSSPSNYSTLPYEHQDEGAKAKDRETRGRLSSGFYSDLEREGVRTRSRRSDKCLFSDSPSPLSTLTLVEEVESDQSQISVPRMSESFNVRPAAPSPKAPPLQTSAILEYLSLPGFIEMSVDEPVEEAEVTGTDGQSSALKAETSLVTKPDVVPKNWEVHAKEIQGGGGAEPGIDACRKQGYKRSLHVETRDSSHRVRFPDEMRPSSHGPEKTSKQLYDEKTQIRAAIKSTESRPGSRTLSGMGPPRPFIKKSISLGSQNWEHFESPRPYISERSYWDEFPNPDVRVKSHSLGRSPSFLPRPGPSWREYVPFRRPSIGSLERPHHTQRPLASPCYLTPAMYPPRNTSISPMLEPSDPRRQAAVFLESSRWSPSYQETLRSSQHKYVPMPSCIPVPQYQHWPGSRGESMRPMDPTRGPPREGESYRQPDRMMARGGEAEIRQGGRTSYASQSSGRGSAGLFQHSLSITPTLLSSPETTEESERHRAETDRPERRAKRRNTSVDESYEWDSADACVDLEVLDAMRFDQSQVSSRRGRGELSYDQAGGVQDQQQKDTCDSDRQ